MFAWGYLLFFALCGYYVRVMGGDWGDALQVLFFTISLVFLATLLVSRRIRAKLMVLISQNFFDYKYDYREEWLKMTRELADLSDDPPLPQRVIRMLAGLVESNAGAIWLIGEQDAYLLKEAVNLSTPKYTMIDGDSELVTAPGSGVDCGSSRTKRTLSAITCLKYQTLLPKHQTVG